MRYLILLLLLSLSACTDAQVYLYAFEGTKVAALHRFKNFRSCAVVANTLHMSYSTVTYTCEYADQKDLTKEDMDLYRKLLKEDI